MREFFLQNRVLLVVVSILIGSSFLLLSAGGQGEAPSSFDWDQNAWLPAGSITQTYPGIGSPATVFTFTFSGYTNRLQQGKPTTNLDITGGIHPPQNTLYYSAKFRSLTETITLTIDLSIEAFNISFLMMDVDKPLDNAVDRVEVTGRDEQGGIILPTLTALGSCVSVGGTVATGICAAANNSGDGNVDVQFGSTIGITKILIVFSEGAQLPDTESHGIALHDIYFEPEVAIPTPTITLTPPPSIPGLYLPVVLKQ